MDKLNPMEYIYYNKSFRNIFEQSIDDIWNHNGLQELRATVNTEDMLEVCKNVAQRDILIY